MNAIVKFGDWFTWEAHDDYVNEAINDSSDIAVVINAVLSDEAKMKQHNFKDHGDVNGIHLYTFMTDEYIYLSATIPMPMKIKRIYSDTRTCHKNLFLL